MPLLPGAGIMPPYYLALVWHAPTTWCWYHAPILPGVGVACPYYLVLVSCPHTTWRWCDVGKCVVWCRGQVGSWQVGPTLAALPLLPTPAPSPSACISPPPSLYPPPQQTHTHTHSHHHHHHHHPIGPQTSYLHSAARIFTPPNPNKFGKHKP